MSINSSKQYYYYIGIVMVLVIADYRCEAGSDVEHIKHGGMVEWC